jgi:hypothetical protein
MAVWIGGSGCPAIDTVAKPHLRVANSAGSIQPGMIELAEIDLPLLQLSRSLHRNRVKE